MTSLLTIMPSSTSHPSPLTFRRCTTITKPDHRQGLVIEYTAIDSPRTSPTNATHSTPGDTKLPPLKGVESQSNNNNNNTLIYNNPNSSRRQRSWLGLPTSNPTTVSLTDKKRRLERMNLRSENRTLNNRASISQRTNSSCKRSDSATNDSQKSALTGNSLDDRLSEDKLKQISQIESYEKEEELTEEKIHQRRNFQKCMNWIEALPTKFSGMHIAQERAPVTND